MLVKFKITIGFPGADREDEVEIEPDELEDADGNPLEGEARDERIEQLVWDYAMQYVDVPWKIVEDEQD